MAAQPGRYLPAENAPGHFELMEELEAQDAVYDVYLVNPVPLVESYTRVTRSGAHQRQFFMASYLSDT